MNAAHGGARIVIGRRRYGAGIEDGNVGLVRSNRPLEAAFQQAAFERGAIGLGGPATEVFHEVARHGAIITIGEFAILLRNSQPAAVLAAS